MANGKKPLVMMMQLCIDAGDGEGHAALMMDGSNTGGVLAMRW